MIIIEGIKNIGLVVIIVHITKTRILGGGSLGVVVVIFELARTHGWSPHRHCIWEGRDIGPMIIITVHIKDRTRILGGVRLGVLVVILELARTTSTDGTVQLLLQLQVPFKILLKGGSSGIMLTDDTSFSCQIFLDDANSVPVLIDGTSVVSCQIPLDGWRQFGLPADRWYDPSFDHGIPIK
jgi:hypothetical protein